MSDITKLFLIKLHPQKGTAPVTIERAEAAVNPNNIGDGTTATATSTDPRFFLPSIPVKAGECCDFSVVVLEGICEIIILPLGWPAGGCGLRCHTPLGSNHFEAMRDLKIYGANPPETRTLRGAGFRCTGEGLLTYTVHGVVTKYNLNTNVYADGLCIALVPRGTNPRVVFFSPNPDLGFVTIN